MQQRQLVRCVLVETLLIASTASLVGMGLGAATLRIFVSQASSTISGLHRAAIELPVAIAIAALTVMVTLLCGAVPAWHAARADFSPFLRATAASRPRAWRVRSALVIAQIAFSCVLLIGAGLLARTVVVLMHEDHGLQPNGALEAKVVLSDTILFSGSGQEGRSRFARARSGAARRAARRVWNQPATSYTTNHHRCTAHIRQ